jgi:tetratricopeptide (TPR) repeat protein
MAARLDATTPALGALGHAYALQGRRADALRIRKEMESRLTASSAAPAFALGQIDMGLGDYDQAMDWFEKASQARYWGVLWLYACPRFDPLRGNPRFVALLQSMDLAAAPHFPASR